MKKKLLYLFYTLFLILGSNLSYGQAFTATYAFGSVAATTGLTDPTPVPTATGVTFGSFLAVLAQQNGYATPVAPATNPNASGRFSFITWPFGATNASDSFTGALDPNQYYQVTITPNAGTSVTLTNMTFTFQRSSTGVRQYVVRSSIDNYASNLPASLGTGASAELSVVATNIFQCTDNLTSLADGSVVTFNAGAFANITAPITLRFYGFNAEATGGTFSIDNVVINGTSQVAAVTPTFTANPTTLDFGTNQAVNSTSAAKSFVLSGTNVTAATTLNVTGPYTISSTSGGTYATSLTFTATELAASPSVFVKFAPTAVGASPGSIAITSGTGSTSVPLTGTSVSVTNPATLTVTPATLTFTNQVVNTSSASQFFNFSATNLSDVVTATASGPYLVSKDGVAFSNVVTFTTTEAATSPKVYVQFTPTALGAAAASTITIATATAASKTVALTGTGVAATPPAGTANHVVISELYGGNGNTYASDYIELYNPTSADVDMSNWSVQYNSATGTGAFSGITVFPAGSVIKSHGYFLVQEFTIASGTPVGGAIPTPDLATTGSVNNFNMSGTAGKIALVNNSTILAAKPTLPSSSIIDFVGYGTTAVYYEGTSYAPAPSPTTSIERKALSTSTAATMAAGGTDDAKGNGFDDDDNANDFFVPTVMNPQNSSSPIEPVTPTYTATPTPLTFSQNVNTTSAGVPVTLTGLGTLPLTSVGTSGPYLISKTATGGYTNTLTFTAAEMAATTKPVVYVQFTPTALGAANSNLYITGVGAVQQIIPLNGTGTAQPVPTLTTTPSSLTFSAFVGVIAPVQTYTLTGTNITQPTILTATGPYLISKDGITFTASVTFATTELNAAQTPTVYVQFTPTAVGASNGTVVQTTTGGGTVSATVTLNGTGITPPNVAPTLNAIADQSVCSVTTPATIALTGITVGPSSETATQAISSLSVTSNNAALFASLGVTPVIGGTSNLNYAIANGQTGTAVVTVTVKDNGGVLNGGVDTYTRTFNVTVNALAVVTITSDATNNIVEKGATATLTATGGTTYAWTTNASITSGLATASITIRPSATTTYTVSATNATGCVTTQTITITVRNAFKLETGNVLTPNGDGKNDYWVVRNIDLYQGNTVKVYDKTGKLVFTKTGYNNDWNGYYNGSPLPQGIYYYVVDLGVGLPYKGTLSVVRDK